MSKSEKKDNYKFLTAKDLDEGKEFLAIYMQLSERGKRDVKIYTGAIHDTEMFINSKQTA